MRAVVSLPRVDHQVAHVLSDTDVYIPAVGMYERMVIFNDWLDDQPKVLGRVWLRVHRQPVSSFARGSIWVSDNGWFEVASANKDKFWTKAPGYERAHALRTGVETMKIVHEVIAKMQEVVADIQDLEHDLRLR